MLEVVKLILKYVSYFFVLYMIFYSTFLFVSALIGSLKIYKNRYKDIMRNKIHHDYYVPVSILIPAYNEEKVIVSSVKSLFSLDYKLFEIIVINDGSTDNTLEVLKKAFNLLKVDKPYKKQLNTKEVYNSLNIIYSSNLNQTLCSIISNIPIMTFKSIY